MSVESMSASHRSSCSTFLLISLSVLMFAPVVEGKSASAGVLVLRQLLERVPACARPCDLLGRVVHLEGLPLHVDEMASDAEKTTDLQYHEHRTVARDDDFIDLADFLVLVVYDVRAFELARTKT